MNEELAEGDGGDWGVISRKSGNTARRNRSLTFLPRSPYTFVKVAAQTPLDRASVFVSNLSRLSPCRV